jgi:hypothetical protein
MEPRTRGAHPLRMEVFLNADEKLLLKRHGTAWASDSPIRGADQLSLNPAVSQFMLPLMYCVYVLCHIK